MEVEGFLRDLRAFFLKVKVMSVWNDSLYTCGIHIMYLFYHIVSYHIVSYCIISYHILSYHIISHHITSYHVYTCIYIVQSNCNIIISESNDTSITCVGSKRHKKGSPWVTQIQHPEESSSIRPPSAWWFSISFNRSSRLPTLKLTARWLRFSPSEPWVNTIKLVDCPWRMLVSGSVI